MKHGPVAKIRFRQADDPKTAALPTKRYAALAKLQSDPPEYPFGRWSLCAELWQRPDETGTAMAWVQFLSPDAPTESLRTGERFTLYDGQRPVADVQMVLSKIESSELQDADFLAGERERPRRVA